MSWPWESKAAVDERFYSQQRTAFTVTSADTWRGPGFSVKDLADGEARMDVQTTTADLRNGNLRSIVLLDEESHGVVPAVIAAAKECPSGISGQRHWEAFRGRGTSETDRLFVAVDKTRLFQMGITVHVFLDGNSSGDQVPDFVVHGSYYLGTMTVSRGGGVTGGDSIAKIQNDTSKLGMLDGDYRYTTWINRGVDQVFVLALVLILDQMYSFKFDPTGCEHHHR